MQLTTAEGDTYIAAAIADGWAASGIYTPGGEYVRNRSTALTRDGFKIHAYCHADALEPEGYWFMSCWGPDGMAISLKAPYSMDQIRDGVHVCGECGAWVERTECVAFANRCCPTCAPALRERLEKPGWCD